MRIVVMGPSDSGKALIGAAVAASLRSPFIDGDDLLVSVAARLAPADVPAAWLDGIAWALRHPAVVVACPLLARSGRDRIRSRVSDVIFVELVAAASPVIRTRVPRRDRAARAAKLDQPPARVEPLGSDEAGIRVADDADLGSVVQRIVDLLVRAPAQSLR